MKLPKAIESDKDVDGFSMWVVACVIPVIRLLKLSITVEVFLGKPMDDSF